MDDLSCGYSYEFVDPNVPDEFTCLICTMVAREAHQSGCCGRIFCLGCLETLKNKSRHFSCPNCRSDLHRNYFADKNTMRKIRQFSVYCPNKDRGCCWTGELQSVHGHMCNCPKERVSCPNDCSVEVERCGLTEHLNSECVRRFVECEHCGIVAEYRVITGGHAQLCSAAPTLCPNEGCVEKLKQAYVEGHLRVCPKGIVGCKYSNICEKKIAREDEQKHYHEEMEWHLERSYEELQKLKNKCDGFSKEIRELNTTLSIVTMNNRDSTLKVLDSVSSLSTEFKQSQTRCEDPIKFKVKDFNITGEKKSFDFYFCKGGHKFRFTVHPNGIGHALGSYISLTLEVIDGEYDDILDERFSGGVTVDLLNQCADDEHCEGTFQFTHKKFGVRKCTTIYRFCDHDDLYCGGYPNYYENGNLYFKLECYGYDAEKSWLV